MAVVSHLAVRCAGSRVRGQVSHASSGRTVYYRQQLDRVLVGGVPGGRPGQARIAAEAGGPRERRGASGQQCAQLGEGRPLASVADDEIGEALELLWGEAAVNTWNTRRASVLSWLG